MRALFLALPIFLLVSQLHPARGAPKMQEKNNGYDWAEVEKLANEQKYQAALDATMKVLNGARERKEERVLTEALVKATQLEMGLHGFETAVRLLKETPWPQNGAFRALLDLYYGHALMAYQGMYGWEIGQREKTVSTSSVDLKAWTTAQIGQEIGRSFDSAMAEGQGLDEPVPPFFRAYITAGNYPEGIRSTLRDVVVYMAVDHMANRQFWTPLETNEVYKLKFAKLSVVETAKRIPAADEKNHPLVKIESWLGEHLRYHAAHGRAEAQLEARYTALRILHDSATEAADKKTVVDSLRSLQAALMNAKTPWWSRGQAQLAEFLRANEKPGYLIDVRREAQIGRDAFSQSVGGQMCASILFEIERPEYSVQMMASDAASKRSILVDYRNFRKIFFRVYPVDLEKLLHEARGNALGNVDSMKLQAMLKAGEQPAAAWSVDLPDTRDFTQHRAFLATPKLNPGIYVFVSSLTEDFRESGNSVFAIQAAISDLVLSSRNTSDGKLEVKAVSGESGKPIEGANLTLYRINWQTAPVEAKTERTDANGYALFQQPTWNKNEYGQFFLVGRHKENVAINNQNVYFGHIPEESIQRAAFLFTDRSIYRPQQKIYFKVVGYRGKHSAGKFESAKAGEMVRVELLDPNYQVVASKQVELGPFGTGAGEFVVPAGRLLGNWQLRVAGNYPGSAALKVEEYKRPTFEPVFKEAAEPLRLNRKAHLLGEAKYYFGTPVTSGNVRWRVTRAEVSPWWWEFWGWWQPQNHAAAQTVASGTAEMKADGTFALEFTPEADERKAGENGLSYNFRVEADITDEGGETRTATRSFRLGLVAVEAKLDWEKGFFSAGQPINIHSVLSNLDGKPLKGQGTFKVSRLDTPATSMPVDLPLDGEVSQISPRWQPKTIHSAAEKGTSDFASADDSRRARWETAFRWETVTRSWKEAEVIAEGKVEHNEKGEGTITVKSAPKTGVYRISYKTVDAFGAMFEVSRDFLVGSSQPDIKLPILLATDAASKHVGDTARILVHSGLSEQPLTVEVFRSGKRLSRKAIVSGRGGELLELPITLEDRGGFTLLVTGMRDHQVLRAEANVQVPWSDRELKLEFSTFRDKMRPAEKETFRVTVKNEQGKALESGAAEILAYMYDRSLDLFTPHIFPNVMDLYPGRTGAPIDACTLGVAPTAGLYGSLPNGPPYPYLTSDQLQFPVSYGIGGPGNRGGFGGGRGMGGPMAMMAQDSASLAQAPGEGFAMAKSSRANLAPMAAAAPGAAGAGAMRKKESAEPGPQASSSPPADLPVAMRSNFSEQAFFAPHLISGPGGSASIEFTTPDSVTSWKVLAHAITTDLRGGSVSREARTVKELMVRPYAPRFLREGDEAEIKVQINNASEADISGELVFDIEDNLSTKSALQDFGIVGDAKKSFQVAKGNSVTLGFPIRAPRKVGDYAFKVVARAKNYSDGERRPFPLLPSRMHLAQSRFVSLHHKDKKVLEFKDLAAGGDPTLINEQMVVTVDAQLFYGVLQALPYLVKYPYECVEQTMNRFVSTGIVSSLFTKFPSVAKMAKEFSARKTVLERFDDKDPNRRMALEETPWLQEAQGGKAADDTVANVLNPEVAKAERDSAMEKLRRMQLSSGGFPWFQGGPADEHMTLYVLLGLSRALEFQVEVPKDVVANAWRFLKSWLDEHLEDYLAKNVGWETITMINFVLSSYPDDSWTSGLFDLAYRQKLLAFSFSHWKEHAPLVKGYLALTLNRMSRGSDAKLVWDSVMDSAKNDDQLGTYWAREDRSWLWYNDEIETHAFALRVQMELNQKDKHNEGIVQWLFLNKKLNHWKSTRATAEVIYALTHYLDKTSQLGQREAVTVNTGTQTTEFQFDPDKYTGKKNQIVIPGEKVDSKRNSRIEVSKSTPGFAFASATWQFSTDKLPAEATGDFFSVTRKFFKREHVGANWQLRPIQEGAQLQVGDQIEVQLSLRTKHAAEYVHLRDPRGAGFETENLVSGYKWDLGIFWYEETRDSGSNFFFSALPVGEYTFKYRLRANMAGNFRVGPATVQSMYAPEFNAYSSGEMLKVEVPR